jgi:hypothetical protein
VKIMAAGLKVRVLFHKNIFVKISVIDCDTIALLLFVADRTSEFWFFQGPLLLMLLCNVGFSLSTLASIYKIKNGSKLLNESESRTYKSKENWQK